MTPAREPDYEELRFYLTRLRRTRHWTLDELAERSGVSRRSIVQLESGHSRGSLDSWFALAEAFEIEIGEMLSALYGRSRTRAG